jgi:ADP-ribose pyrophosphatase YjhB (NUDIX family)
MVEFANYKEEKLYYETVASEVDFVEWYKKQDLPKYETPSLTIDNVMLAYDEETKSVKILLIQRKANPFRGKYALPGGFVDKGEDTDEACIRETKEEVGVIVTQADFEQFHTFSKPGRDPRSWVVSCGHITYLPYMPEVEAGDDAKSATWFTIKLDSTGKVTLYNGEHNLTLTMEDLAFDHADILTMAIDRIKGSLETFPRILLILGEEYTFEDIRNIYSIFIGDLAKDLTNSEFFEKYEKAFSIM